MEPSGLATLRPTDVMPTAAMRTCLVFAVAQRGLRLARIATEGGPNRGFSVTPGWRRRSTAGVFRSTKEAGMRIVRHERSEIIDRIHLWSGFIAVPLQIATLPEHSPDAARPHVGCLRHGRLVFLAGRSAPGRSDLKDLNALPSLVRVNPATARTANDAADHRYSPATVASRLLANSDIAARTASISARNGKVIASTIGVSSIRTRNRSHSCSAMTAATGGECR
jgi:hypothetical protein